MDPFGLVVHDQESFLHKVVSSGTEQGIFTRDRADEIIRVSVAMSNKYVLQKGIDFRSQEELAEVQTVVLKLVGIGLEMKSEGRVEEAIKLLMDHSPVDLFRLAYTRVDKLRHRWKLLLQDHKIQILVSPEEYQCLTDLSCQRLSEMSIFTETELDTISALTLEDQLFSGLDILEYYESEVEKYEFTLRLRQILPFDLLNRSQSVRGENLAEVDSTREAFVNTLIISGCVEAQDPVAVSMADIRRFLVDFDTADAFEVMPAEVENMVVDLVDELGEGLDDSEATLLTREIINLAQRLVETIMNEWDTIDSPDDTIFFKRWCRMAIISDLPDPVSRILSSDEMVDEFDLDILEEQITRRPESDALELIGKLPWNRLLPDRIIRLFQDLSLYQSALAQSARIEGFNAAELVDLVEILSPEATETLLPDLERSFHDADFTLEDLEIIGGLPQKEIGTLLMAAKPPVDLSPDQLINEFADGTDRARRTLLLSCLGSESFPDFFQEAWLTSRDFVKKVVRGLSPSEVAQFVESAAGGEKPKILKSKEKDPEPRFSSQELNSFVSSLPKTKKKAVVAHFNNLD
ncbi:DUF6178 family protein [Thermodesulfobacteriota bacterium]